ncbi:MAG: hypothetical protein AB1750_15330 [Chloroflexota bacterium]
MKLSDTPMEGRMKRYVLTTALIAAVLLATGCRGGETRETASPLPVQTEAGEATSRADASPGPHSAPELPPFIYTVRAYGGGGYDQFQCETMKQMGLEYVQGLVDFSWVNLQRGYDIWKWEATDAQMDALAKCGMKTIAFTITPKLEGLHWDESVRRDDPRYVEAYGEFAYRLVERYHDHPAWSGLVTVWGGSSDVWGESWAGEPRVVVPLMNAAYDGIKRADPNTIVAGFNMATTFTTGEDWKQWHERAFAFNPRFDWFGVQSHAVPPTMIIPDNIYAGLAGLTNVRRFLDEHGYADKPMWLNEGGFPYGEDLGGLPEDIHAQFVAETFLLAPALGIDLRGWVYFQYFDKTRNADDMGLMTTLAESDPPRPRLAWTALQTLFAQVSFFDYAFVSRISGEFNQPDPYVLLFARPDGARLWAIFSPRVKKGEPVNQPTTIHIAPAGRAILVSMLGEQLEVVADANGNVTVASSAEPVYVVAGR